MTDEELKKLQEQIDNLYKERSDFFEKKGDEINKLMRIFEKEKKEREFEKQREDELKAMCDYLDTVNRESWCVKYRGGLWMSKNKKTTWDSEGKARAAIKNSLANFNSYYDKHGQYHRPCGTVEQYYEYLIDNKLIEFCKLVDVKKGE